MQFRAGALHPNWKGGRHIASGYIFTRIDGGYRMEQELVMERELGRPLRDEEMVHHVNGVTDDNRPDNLQILTQSEHARLHIAQGDRPQSAPHRPAITCPTCGQIEPHFALGLCKRCWYRQYKRKYDAAHREYINTYAREWRRKRK